MSLPGDVRMRGFQQRTTVDAALEWVDEVAKPLAAERVSLHAVAGRVLAEDVISQVNVPAFARSMMDGYAVRGEDTQGATAYNPLPLAIVDEALPGKPSVASVAKGQAVRAMTGAPMPAGADAVLPVELTEMTDQPDVVHAVDSVPVGKNVGSIGEDIADSTQVLAAGRRLRPQDVGVLSSIGVAEVVVVRQPTVRILVTGDELLPAGSQPQGYQIVDANSPMLAALVDRDGGIPQVDMIADQPEAILAALKCDSDVVLVSGGSSVGQEDHAPALLREHGELPIHGVAMRPSSPAGMGRLDERLVFLLPGNPVSCLCAYDFFAGRAIRKLGGRAADWPYPSQRLPLARKISSVVGRLDYARVTVDDGAVTPLAISGASMLSSTTRADGFVVISADSEGHPPGAEVEVFMYDLP